MPKYTFYEFFAGGGMARAGLGDAWRCAFANDFDAMKVATYEANWGSDDIRELDVAKLTLADLPEGTVDLAWASFPCQDLSLAGGYRGLGRERDNTPTRSGTFWPFWRLIRELTREGRMPRAIVLENVYGCLTSRQGQDFAALALSLADTDYQFGAVVINAAHFVPQSRLRVFLVAFRKNESIPAHLLGNGPHSVWHPAALQRAYQGVAKEAKRKWLWLTPPIPEQRATTLTELIETRPTGVDWHSVEETKYLLSLMSEVNLAKLATAKASGRRRVGTVYRRTRLDKNGAKCQRAEVRFDDVSGCLRTPSGGSSRQTILVVEGKKVRSRLLSGREAARLMGLRDDYKLPQSYTDAYHVCGDGVCVPVVEYIAKHILEPILSYSASQKLIAAE